MTSRTLTDVRTLPPPAQGQFGPDHTVVEVIVPQQWADADPFIVLMDDRVDGRMMGGPHPHAGFETVTFVVDGPIPTENRYGGALQPGDVEWTTAGSGIVHGPEAPVEGRMRVLQLWLTLPKADRWTEQDHQILRRGEVPVRREPGAEVRVYSGRSGAVASSARNRVPVLLLDVALEPGARLAQEVPASHNGFVYPLAGETRVGADGTLLRPGQIGWSAPQPTGGDTSLSLENASAAPSRVLVYSGQRQNVPIAWHGPFIGDTRDDLLQSMERFRSGTFRRI